MYLIEYLKTCANSTTSLLGLVASIIVLVSMCFNTRSRRGELWMRTTNLIGSIISVIYGGLLGPDGLGMIILNGTLVAVNLYYLMKAVIKN